MTKKDNKKTKKDNNAKEKKHTVDSQDTWELAQKHGLNRKMYLFAEYMLQNGGNQTQACISAGYSKKSSARQGVRLATNDKVIAYTKERVAEVDKGLVMDANEVLERLTVIGRGEATEQVAVGTKEGVAVVTVEASVRDRTKALETLGKHYVLWTEKKEVEQETTIVINSGYVSPKKK